MGYAGGTKEDPTYHHLGDHSETIEIDFDPRVVSYEDLLALFWRGHSPDTRSWSRQYMSAIFYHNEEQKRLALETRDREAARRGGKLYTEILPAGRFTRAEDYHQKYYLRMRPELTRAVRKHFRSEEEFVDSSVAARLNGYFGGDATVADVEAAMREARFSDQDANNLLKILERSRK